MVEWDENGVREFPLTRNTKVRIALRRYGGIDFWIGSEDQNWAITPDEARAISARLNQLADEIDAEKK